MYTNMKPQRGVTPGRKTPAPKRPAPKPPVTSDPVEVFCRIRPLDNPNIATCVKVISPTTIHITPGENSHAVRTAGVIRETQYTFSHVFDEYSSQKAIFEHIALPLVENVLHGKNALLFAYGVTGSGKTYTMTGSPQDPGILPRCLDVLFNSIGNLQAKKYVFKPDKMNGFDVQTEADAMLERQRRDVTPKLTGVNVCKTPGPKEREDVLEIGRRLKDTSIVQDIEEDNNYAVFLSYVEIYNKYIYDLLEEMPYDPIVGNKPPVSKNLREDNNHIMYVSGVVEVEVKSTEEAYELIAKGHRRRRVAETTLNSESSRSHSVLNIRLVQAPLDLSGEEVLQDKEKVCVSQVSLVDLAGSERTSRTGNQGSRLREAGNINQSLMVLRSCIEALRENQRTGINKVMVPYRDCRLTNLFKNYFDGEGQVRMTVCVNPKDDDYDETINVMKFAEMTQEVKVARQQKIQFDLGLTPGRRRQRQQYLADVERMKQEGVTEIVPEPLIYSMGPPFPSLELREAFDDGFMPILAKFLQARELRRSTLIADMGSKEDRFRTRLVEMEQENLELRQRLAELESNANSRDGEQGRLQRRVRSLETKYELLQRNNNQVEREKRELEREVGDRELKIQEAQSMKSRLHQDYRAKLALSEQNFNRRMEQTKRKLHEETNARLNSKQKKLEMVRHIINGENSDRESTVSAGSGYGGRYGGGGAAASTSRIYPAKSEPDLSAVLATSTPRTHHTRAMTTASQHRPDSTPRAPHLRAQTTAHTQPINGTKAVPRTARAKSPPPVKPKPVLNPKYHRRSRSHEAWLDHKPNGLQDSATIMAPNVRVKKSVATLNARDTRNVDKYLLTHTGLDSEGEMATKLVKNISEFSTYEEGDVLRTSGGGTAVIFNDVETLKHKSPGDRKRRSDEPGPEDYDGEWSDIETRCKVAIEHHGNLKRVKTSQV